MGENCKFPKAISDLVNAANKNEEIIYRGVKLFYKNPKEMTKDMYIDKLIECLQSRFADLNEDHFRPLNYFRFHNGQLKIKQT